MVVCHVALKKTRPDEIYDENCAIGKKRENGECHTQICIYLLVTVHLFTKTENDEEYAAVEKEAHS